VGELPDGSALTTSTGELTELAQKFLEMIQMLAEGDSPVGIRPFGSKTDFLANGSNAWQVFSENVTSREKAAARIYLGTDATLGSVGGAPGVDIAELFGVASTKIQGDVTALQDGLLSGLYEPWCAINFGTSRYAPAFAFELPDPDAERKRVGRAANRERFAAALRAMREAKLDVTQDVVNTLAIEYDITPAPTLASAEVQTSSLVLAPTDIAKVVRVREARSAQGLPPFGDARDEMTIAELDAWIASKTTTPTQ
jgi:hypothetical protein